MNKSHFVALSWKQCSPSMQSCRKRVCFSQLGANCLYYFSGTRLSREAPYRMFLSPPWQLLYNNGGEGGIAVKTNNLVGGISDYFRYVSFVVQHFKHIFSDKQTKCRTQNNAGRATKENFIGSRLSLICRYILDHPIWDVTRVEKTEGELWLWPEIQF